ncbi:MAG: hypothetical protein GOU99_01580 [Candidatus Altiarchaeota archaeon]|nr:hypothetical protein [Candidatus Altiarchaeota archaeon]
MWSSVILYGERLARFTLPWKDASTLFVADKIKFDDIPMAQDNLEPVFATSSEIKNFCGLVIPPTDIALFNNNSRVMKGESVTLAEPELDELMEYGGFLNTVAPIITRQRISTLPEISSTQNFYDQLVMKRKGAAALQGSFFEDYTELFKDWLPLKRITRQELAKLVEKKGTGKLTGLGVFGSRGRNEALGSSDRNLIGIFDGISIAELRKSKVSLAYTTEETTKLEFLGTERFHLLFTASVLSDLRVIMGKLSFGCKIRKDQLYQHAKLDNQAKLIQIRTKVSRQDYAGVVKSVLIMARNALLLKTGRLDTKFSTITKEWPETFKLIPIRGSPNKEQAKLAYELAESLLA